VPDDDDPDRNLLLLVQAQALSLSCHYTLAADYYVSLLENLSPDHQLFCNAKAELGACLYQAGLGAEGLPILRDAAMTFNSSEAMELYIEVLIQSGELADAAEACKYLAAATKQSVKSFQLRANCFFRLGDYERSRHFALAGLVSYPDNAELRVMLERVKVAEVVLARRKNLVELFEDRA
jgi:tetratricopeptide (TPR) repeat protein